MKDNVKTLHIYQTLSPLLFNIYFNNLSKLIFQNMKLYQFTVDSCFISQAKNKALSIKLPDKTINNMQDWRFQKKLVLNLSKTSVNNYKKYCSHHPI